MPSLHQRFLIDRQVDQRREHPKRDRRHESAPLYDPVTSYRYPASHTPMKLPIWWPKNTIEASRHVAQAENLAHETVGERHGPQPEQADAAGEDVERTGESGRNTSMAMRTARTA